MSQPLPIMSATTIELLTEFGRATQQLEDASWVLSFEVGATVKARHPTDRTWRANKTCREQLTHAVTSAEAVADQLRLIVPALTPSVLPTAHNCPKTIGALLESINKFLAVALLAMRSRWYMVRIESIRELFIAKEAANLECSVADMLQSAIAAKLLIDNMKDMVESKDTDTPFDTTISQQQRRH